MIKGELLHIGNLRPWDLYSVLTQKYSWPSDEARSFASFLEPMLEYDTRKRATALECLQHSWIQTKRVSLVQSESGRKSKANDPSSANEETSKNNQRVRVENTTYADSELSSAYNNHRQVVSAPVSSRASESHHSSSANHNNYHQYASSEYPLSDNERDKYSAYINDKQHQHSIVGEQQKPNPKYTSSKQIVEQHHANSDLKMRVKKK